MEIIIAKAGNARCVYNEVINLAALGTLKITRGSHVEPDDQGRWVADLCPVGGPVLGPFGLRSEALDAELVWLETHWLLNPDFEF